MRDVPAERESERLCHGKDLSGRPETVLRPGAELLFLSGRGRCMPARIAAEQSRKIPEPVSVLCDRISSAVRSGAGACGLRLFMPVRPGSGSSVSDPSFQEDTDLSGREIPEMAEVCDRRGTGNLPAADLFRRALFLQVCLSGRNAVRCDPPAFGGPAPVGPDRSAVLVEGNCPACDRSGQPTDLPSVLPVSVPAGRILRSV